MDGEIRSWHGPTIPYRSLLSIQKPVFRKPVFRQIQIPMIWRKIEMDYAPRKIALPKEREVQNAFSVQKHHLDTNHHVNNCQYIRMAAIICLRILKLVSFVLNINVRQYWIMLSFRKYI